jgi:hypothetical protein
MFPATLPVHFVHLTPDESDWERESRVWGGMMSLSAASRSESVSGSSDEEATETASSSSDPTEEEVS